MPIIGSYVMKTTLLGTFNGVKTTNKFLHYPVTGARVTPATFATAFESVINTDLLPVLSEHMTLTRLIVDEVGPTGALQEQRVLGLQGSVAGEALPPYAVYSYRKSADNAQIEGTDLTPFQLGGFRLSGVPEANQNEGFLTTAAINALNTLGEDLRLFVFGGDDYQMYMERPDPLPNMPPASAAPVAAVVVSSILGTQNTRKY